MSIYKALKDRIGRAEAALSVSQEEPPTLFVRTVDASDEPDGTDYSDAGVMGAQDSTRAQPTILRLPGEPLDTFQARAAKLLPSVRVFFLCYGASPWGSLTGGPHGTN